MVAVVIASCLDVVIEQDHVGHYDRVMTASSDFDFWIGHWQVRNERLKGRLCGSTEWETFFATAEARFLPGGLGNIDQFVITDDWRPGFVGLTVRLLDPASGLWRLY